MQARLVTRRPLVVNASGGQPNKPLPPPRASKRVSMIGLAAAWEALVRPFQAFAETTLPSLDFDRSVPTAAISDDTVDSPASDGDDSNSSPDTTKLGAVESRGGGGGGSGGRRR